MSQVLDLLVAVLLFVGALLCFTGGVGLLRLPDFFSRAHAASVTETLATPLLIVAVLLSQEQFSLDSIKLLMIMLIILATNPTAAHAMTKAALHGGLKPWQKPETTHKPTEGTGDGDSH